MATVLSSKEFTGMDKQVNAILGWDEVRFAGFVSGHGRLVLGGFKKGVEPFVSDADMQKMYMELALRVSMRKDFDSMLGAVLFSASRRKNAVMLSFPIRGRVLLVSAETSIDIEEFASKVLDKINSS